MGEHEELRRDPVLLAAAKGDDGDALALLALLALCVGDEDEARDRFRHAARIDHGTGHHGLAAFEERDGDPDQAWTMMQRALTLGAVPALTRLARIALLRGADDAGRHYLLCAARLGDADAMYDVAHLATDDGDDATARRWYGAAIDCESGAEWPIERGVGFLLL